MFTPNPADFNCNIAITNPSPTTRDMINDLPDNYTQSQNSNIFTLLYGTGYELDNLQQTLRQLEANNYLYSPDTQNHALKVNGAGSYLVQFDVPFVVPPLNVSVSGADYSDIYIEYADRFGMVIQVLTDISDVLSWTATGFVGAATDEALGDSLYQNFGSLFNFPRQGDSQVDTTFVTKYEITNNFITVESIVSFAVLLFVQFTQTSTINSPNPTIYSAPYIYGKGIDYSGFPDNPNFVPGLPGNAGFPSTDATMSQAIIQPNFPPVNNIYTKGFLQPTAVVSEPPATHELVDQNGNLIALLDASTIGQGISAFYQNSPAPNANYYMANLPNQVSTANTLIHFQDAVSCYITGFQNTYAFNRWDQISYQQEVFRADNKYRRLLAGINLSLQEGPSKKGIANIVETLFAQPYIPHEYWTQSDFRVFENTPGQSAPKFMTANTANFATEYGGYPSLPAVVQIQSVENSWNPDSITFNNAPKANDIPIYNSDGSVFANTTSLPITSLNSASRFNLTDKLINDLRLGFDPNSYPQGGVINWNYANLTNSNYINPSIGGVNTGFSLYEGINLETPPPKLFIFK